MTMKPGEVAKSDPTWGVPSWALSLTGMRRGGVCWSRCWQRSAPAPQLGRNADAARATRSPPASIRITRLTSVRGGARQGQTRGGQVSSLPARERKAFHKLRATDLATLQHNCHICARHIHVTFRNILPTRSDVNGKADLFSSMIRVLAIASAFAAIGITAAEARTVVLPQAGGASSYLSLIHI